MIEEVPFRILGDRFPSCLKAGNQEIVEGVGEKPLWNLFQTDAKDGEQECSKVIGKGELEADLG